MQHKRGFTLIELLVVIAIIGILATLVITQISKARVKARNSTAKSDVAEAGKAIEIFKGDEVNLRIIKGVYTPVTGTVSYNNSPINSVTNCTVGVTATTCATAAESPAGAGAADMSAIFKDKMVINSASAGTGNSYGVNFSKTPGSDYYYYYMSSDVAGVATGTLSPVSKYYFIADLGSGGATDGNRYYYIYNGSLSSFPDSGGAITAAQIKF